MIETQISQPPVKNPPISVQIAQPYESTFRKNPYRLFFPLGILAGLFGVGQWIPWSFGLSREGISLSHSLIQAQAFLAFFAAGFLMTAFPWMSGTASATVAELWLVSVPALVFIALALSGWWVMSQAVFLLFMASLSLFVGRRILRRTKNQPSFFFLLGCGLAGAFCGAAFLLLGLTSQKFDWFMSVGRQLMQLGFMLFLIMGVTHELGSFILGHANVSACHREIGGSQCGIFSLAAMAVFLFLSFLMEPFVPRQAAFVRALLVTFHQLHFAQMWRPIAKKNAVNAIFRFSCWIVPLGLWIVFLFPKFRIAGLHLVFIGGFGLMILSFGLLVVINHSARKEDLFSRLILFRVAAILILFSALTRFFADVFSEHYIPLIRGSAVLWVASSVLWLIETQPRLLRRNS